MNQYAEEMCTFRVHHNRFHVEEVWTLAATGESEGFVGGVEVCEIANAVYQSDSRLGYRCRHVSPRYGPR